MLSDKIKNTQREAKTEIKERGDVISASLWEDKEARKHVSSSHFSTIFVIIIIMTITCTCLCLNTLMLTNGTGVKMSACQNALSFGEWHQIIIQAVYHKSMYTFVLRLIFLYSLPNLHQQGCPQTHLACIFNDINKRLHIAITYVWPVQCIPFLICVCLSAEIQRHWSLCDPEMKRLCRKWMKG